jgi:transcriptional regulator with XRE-family HTH domain
MNQARTTKKMAKKKRPKTKLRFGELVSGLSMQALAKSLGVTYTQLYRYKKPGANPTLLVLEELASGLSELRGESLSVVDLLEQRSKSK